MNNQFDSELFRRIKLCPNCSSSKIQSEIFPYPGSLDCGIDLCNECNLAFTNPQINPNRVHELYIGPTDGIRCVDSSISLALRNIKLKFHWSRIIRLFNLPKKLKVLDYGCGDGVLTTILKKNMALLLALTTQSPPLNQSLHFYLRTMKNLRAIIITEIILIS